MRQDSAAFAARRQSTSKEYRFVIGIIYETASIYLTSHADISGVPGTVLNGTLMEPVMSSQRLRPDEARAEIGSASFTILDKSSTFTQAVRDKLRDDDEGIRQRECRFYAGFEGDSFSDLMLVGTQIVDDASVKNGVYQIKCADVQRYLRNDVFDLKVTTLSSTLTAGDTTINATDASAFQRVFHGPSYTDSPNTTVGYIKIKDTIYRYTGKSSNSFTGCVPVFGTIAETVTIDPALAADRREKITEYVYLELPAVKLALALLTGNLYGDGTTLPTHWHMGVPDNWIDEDAFINIGTDLWNPATDASPNAGYMVRFEGVGKTDGKAFLEKELYLLLGLFSPVRADGSLSLRRMARIGPDATPVATLDNSNSISVGDLNHRLKQVHNIFRVNWSWNGERFNRANDYIDSRSRLIHKSAPLYERSFKGLHGSIHTDAAVFTQLDMTRDRYAAPPVDISATLLDSMNAIEVGDVVRCRWQHVRDFTGPEPDEGEPGIDRSMEVQFVSLNFRTGVTVELFGSTAEADVTAPPSGADVALPDDFYDEDGSPLSSAPGITITGGAMTAATTTLAGNASLTNDAAIYYYLGNLTINSGVTLNISQNVQLRVRGFLQVNGTINGIARGLAGVADNSNPDIPVFGNPGYVGSSRGRDGLSYTRGAPPAGSPSRVSTRPAQITVGRYAVAPVLNLTVDGNSITGLPDDLRGTGGGPGEKVVRETPSRVLVAQGMPGVAGGAGLMIICRGMAMGVNGLIDLSGANSATPQGYNAVPSEDDPDSVNGAGGAGGPGAMYVLLDGPSLSVPDLGSNRFRAFTGTVGSLGWPIPVPGPQSFANPPLPLPIAGYASPDVISGANLSGAALRIQYIPASETPQGDTDSAPPPVTNLTTQGVVGAINVGVTAPPPEQWDVIEYYAAVTNDRSGAVLANRSRATSFNHTFATATERFYWARTRLNGLVSVFYPASATAGVPGTSIDAGGGTPGESVEVEFATTAGGTWHSTFTTGDLYMRTRVGSGGAWQGPWRVVGEDGDPGSAGADGNITSFVFRRSATAPATPTGNSPAGWSDAPPSSDGNPLWVSRAQKTPAGILVGTWSVPSIMAVDGEDGEPGIPGIQGPGLFDWVNPVSVTTTATSIARSSGGGAWNAGAHSRQSFSGGAFFSCRAGQTNTRKAIGFNDDPAVDANVTGINRGWWLGEDGNAYIVTNGVQGASQGAYTINDDFQGVHDADTIRLYKNGILVGGDHAYTGRVYLDVSIFTAAGSFVDVHFGASGLRGATGAAGASAQQLRLSSTAQAFAFPAGGGAGTPTSITFTATRTNIATATTWVTTPNVTLTGAGDSRVLTATNMGGNSSVRVRAEADGFFDEITIIRLTQGATGANGQASVVGHLTNENHTLVADPDGVVTDLTSAVGLFIVYEGVADRTAQAAFSIVSEVGCDVQINTADNTPIAGQPRGFYRLQSITADQARARLQASYNGVIIPIDFTITKARQGQPGDGQNMLQIGTWIVGTTGSQGGGYWVQNGLATENSIVLGGAGTAPLGPYRTSIPLWQCQSADGTGTNGDGGWDTIDFAIDYRRSYRSAVWFRVNQLSGSFYHGCRTGAQTAALNGVVEPNPYFAGGPIAGLGVQANKWYLSIGLIHGAGYTGGQSGVSGIYDPETGQRVYAGTDYKHASSAIVQSHRAYHFYDVSTATRQWMPEPRFEEINGSEPTIDSLLGFQRTTPWIARGGCQAGARSFVKATGASDWESADVISAVGYSSCHVQWSPAQTTRHFMIGLSDSQAPSMSYTTIRFALYCAAGGVLQIYESGVFVGDFGSYNTQTKLGITRDPSTNNLYYWKDGVVIRGPVSATAPLYYVDSAFYEVGAGALNVSFGPGTEFELMSPGDFPPNSLTRVYDSYVQGSLSSPIIIIEANTIVSQLSCSLTGQYRAPGSTTLCMLAEFSTGGAITRVETSPEVPLVSSDVNVPTPIEYSFVKLANERVVIRGRFTYTGGFPTPGATKFGYYSANLHVEDILR